MKNFTWKSLIKYSFCAFAFFTMNKITEGVPFALCLLPAFSALNFSPILVGVIFSAVNFAFFTPLQAASLIFSALCSAVVFFAYKSKNKTVKGELVFFVALFLIPYFLVDFNGSIYAKLVYSAIIYAFTIIFSLALKVLFIGKFKRKNSDVERLAFYLFIIIFSLGLIEIINLEIYELIAITVTFFLCRFYKSPAAFIPAFLLPISLSLYSQSFSPLALFEIYCAVILLFVNRSLLLSTLSLVLTQFAVAYLSGEIFAFTLSDYILTFLPTLIFLFTPAKLIESIKNFVMRFEESDLVREIINHERIALSSKLNELSSTFSDLERALNDFDTLILTKERLVENISEECLLNVCSICPFRGDCLKKGNPKKKDLSKLINIGVSKGKITLIDLSRDFSSYCYSTNNMVYEINRLISLYNEHAEKAEKTLKIKNLTSMQSGGIAQILSNLAYDFSSKVDFSKAIEKEIFNALAQKGIVPKQILCIGEEYHFLFSKEKIIFSEISKTLSEILKKEMRLSVKNDVGQGILAIFKSAPAFDASFGIAQICKEGGAISGDCHSLVKINEGVFLITLCDGMGSGERAFKNSQTAINLFETLYKSGLEREKALELANNTLSICAEDSFSSLDCGIFNLNTGKCDCIKIGATYGFLLNNQQVKIIENDSLPLGILDEVTPNLYSFDLVDGDTLIILSDGITDAFFSSADTIDFLERENVRNPQSLADSLLSYALTKNDGVAKDDMTAIVVKIYKR